MSISEAEVIARAACPRCEQPIGEPCVYLLPHADTYVNTPYPRAYPPSLRAKVERAGKPTKHVHPERRDVVFELRSNEPQHLSPGRAGRNEVRVLANLFDGEWHNEDDFLGAKWSGLDSAISRCDRAGWIEPSSLGWNWRITDAAVAALKERA